MGYHLILSSYSTPPEGPKKVLLVGNYINIEMLFAALRAVLRSSADETFHRVLFGETSFVVAHLEITRWDSQKNGSG